MDVHFTPRCGAEAVATITREAGAGGVLHQIAWAAGQWFGKGAERWDSKGEVRARTGEKLLEGSKSPDGKRNQFCPDRKTGNAKLDGILHFQRLQAASVLWSQSYNSGESTVETCHRLATKRASLSEDNAAITRRGEGGIQRKGQGGLGGLFSMALPRNQ